MTYDIPLLTTWAAAGSSLTLLVYLMLGKSSETARQRVAELGRGPSPSATSSPAAQGGVGSQAENRIGRAMERRLAAKDKNDFKQRVVQAGIYRKNAAFVFLAVRVASFASLLGLGLLVGWLRFAPFWPCVGAGVLFGLLGTLAPSFWLDYLRYGRQTRIRRALPDALDLISICLQGGLSLSASLTRVAMELGTAHPLLAVELGIVEREMQMGLTAGEAMRQLAKRFDLEELRSLASVIGQAERFGSSVTKALRSYAEALRSKRRQRAEEMAQKAAVKILFPTLLCIFPGLFIVIMGPAAIRIYEVILSGSPWSQ